MVVYLSTDLKEKEIKEKVYNLIKYLGRTKILNYALIYKLKQKFMPKKEQQRSNKPLFLYLRLLFPTIIIFKIIFPSIIIFQYDHV